MTTETVTRVAPSTGKPGAVRFHPFRDTVTLLRRNIRNQLRDLVAVFAIIGIPVLFLLLFVYVFGGALGPATKAEGAASYVDYVLPGLIIMTVAAGLIGVSTHTAVDMTEGIIARFRTMSIFRPGILIARVLSFVIQTLASIVVVFAIAFAMGLRPNATGLEWLAVIGLLAYLSFMLTWLGLAFGLAAKSVGSASNGPFPLILLPLVGSGIVPTSTMPTGLRYFAEYQPFTSMIETLRGLLVGTPIGNSAVIALCWGGGIGILGFVWSIRAFNRDRAS
ncbi:MAG TPA: ABC transporter permease [Pseudonocardiaceae bacterium]|nr:ABC transporter permease [Pseudonocardiaceae bacterium]